MKCFCPWMVTLTAVLLVQQRVLGQPEECRTAVAADLVFLVDDSWSVGDANFRLVKDFINAIVGSFQNVAVGKAGIRFAVALYSDRPRLKIALTDYITMGEVLVAVRDLPFEGGNTRTGDALTFLADSVFSPAVTRDDAAKIAVLVTDGRSGDPVEQPAVRLQDKGVTVFVVGTSRLSDIKITFFFFFLSLAFLSRQHPKKIQRRN
ncbi:collagen alpha-1(XII) chain-like [Latimeria chalumnae]|uniref:collagen alpha-1(XII) chain-like n=1 Tax=Latimeria chalumnae TaxID=7897 RepID=UPI00313E6B90